MQALKTVTLDAHADWSQMAVISPEGEILIELRVETTSEHPVRQWAAAISCSILRECHP